MGTCQAVLHPALLQCTDTGRAAGAWGSGHVQGATRSLQAGAERGLLGRGLVTPAQRTCKGTEGRAGGMESGTHAGQWFKHSPPRPAGGSWGGPLPQLPRRSARRCSVRALEPSPHGTAPCAVEWHVVPPGVRDTLQGRAPAPHNGAERAMGPVCSPCSCGRCPPVGVM